MGSSKEMGCTWSHGIRFLVGKVIDEQQGLGKRTQAGRGVHRQ